MPTWKINLDDEAAGSLGLVLQRMGVEVEVLDAETAEGDLPPDESTNKFVVPQNGGSVGRPFVVTQVTGELRIYLGDGKWARVSPLGVDAWGIFTMLDLFCSSRRVYRGADTLHAALRARYMHWRNTSKDQARSLYSYLKKQLEGTEAKLSSKRGAYGFAMDMEDEGE